MRTQASGAVSLLALLCIFSFLIDGCAKGPTGPGFELAPAPAADRGRIYVFRSDTRHSLAKIQTTLDGRALGQLRNHEYATIEVSPGQHQLRTQMRGLGLVPMGWNAHRFRVEPGDTIFLHLDLRVESRSASPSSIEISGRSNEVLAENVYILQRGFEEAHQLLKLTTRAPRSE